MLWLTAPLTLAGLATMIIGLAVVAASSEAQCGQSATYGPAGRTPIPAWLVPIYEQAAARYDLEPDGWAFLAAINQVETNFGTDLATSSAGAIGWMQFEPATWAQYGQAIDHTGPPNPNDPWDAIFAAADYLSASGAPANWPTAIYAYNHSDAYVAQVTQEAEQYLNAGTALYLDTPQTPTPAQPTTPSVTTGPQQLCAPTTAQPASLYLTPGATATILPNGQATAPANAPAPVQAAIAAANQITNRPYLYGGGHTQPLTTIAPSYDCSSAVSYLLHGAGLLSDQPEDSTQLESYGDPGPGQWITIYANSQHAFVAVAGIAFDTSNAGNPATSTPPGSGPRWRPNPTGNLADGLIYTVRHPPGL